MHIIIKYLKGKLEDRKDYTLNKNTKIELNDNFAKRQQHINSDMSSHSENNHITASQ